MHLTGMVLPGALGATRYVVATGESVAALPPGPATHRFLMVPAEWPALERLMTKLYPEFVGTHAATGRDWISVFDAASRQFIGVAGRSHGYRRSPWYRDGTPWRAGGAMATMVAAMTVGAHVAFGVAGANRSERCAVTNAGSIKVMWQLGMGGHVGVHGDVAAKASAGGLVELGERERLRQLYAAALPAYRVIRDRARSQLAGLNETDWVPKLAWLEGEPLAVSVRLETEPLEEAR